MFLIALKSKDMHLHLPSHLPPPPTTFFDHQISSHKSMASTLTDEERRKLLKPKVTPEEALSVLYEFYTSEGQQPEVARELDSYDDVNFLVKIDGEKALLKIHNGVESEKYIRVHSAKKAKLNDGDVAAGDGSIIDLHTAVFEHLAKPEFKVTTCKTIPSNKSQEDGDNSVCIKELPVSQI